MLYFITGNRNKFREAQLIVGRNFQQLDMDLPEIQEINAEKIIAAKLAEASKYKKGEFLVDDVSLYLDCLGGKLPGPLVKWFLSSIGEKGIYQIAKNSENYNCQVKVVLGYKDKKGQVRYFDVVESGRVVCPRGKSGFGWDRIFQPLNSFKTYAQMTSEERTKNKIRFKALRKFKKYLDKNEKI